MLDIKNVIMSDLNGAGGLLGRFAKMKSLLDTKCSSNLRLLATKNNINRNSDYQYLVLPVADSTAPVNGIDYIHPVVKPVVDYATAVITKGIAPNGEINFEFVATNEADQVAARQATNMVHKLINQNNDPHLILQHWVMDAALHKNGEMMVSPMRESFVRYVTTQGTLDQLKAFEKQAEDVGLTALRTQRRKIDVDMESVMAMLPGELAGAAEARKSEGLDAVIEELGAADDGQTLGPLSTDGIQLGTDEADLLLANAIARNTIYEAKYKLTGYNVNIKFRPIAQHYFMCDPTVISIQEQPFCGFYKPLSIAEATELYPDIKLDEFIIHAEYSNVGAYQAGSLLNNLALHARDSVPINGLPSMGYSSLEPESRQVTVLTVYNRYDIDGDGELELIELIYSGSYIISAKEVEFIPIANMVPKPLAQNFYGMSIAESVIPMQEYMTAGHRAELHLGLLQSTARIGVKPDKVDFEMMQDGEAAIFILDSKFDPTKDIYPMPAPSGDIRFIDQAINRIQQDSMAMVGMTMPSDVFNPEVMAPGNSAAKLQLALTPNQIIQDNTIKNCAEGLKDAIWLIWRTLCAYGDDHGVRKLAQQFHPEGKPEFIDYENFDNLNYNERKTIKIELALGMRSEENAIQRLTIIKSAQTQLAGEITAGVTSGVLTPAAFKKIRKPYEDMLYVLGVKNCDEYLPTETEVMEMVQQAQAAASNKQPSPDDQKKMADTELSKAKTQEIMANITGQAADKQLEAIALLGEDKAVRY
jgi:hypothetical protein